ncbi:MAG: ATP-binding protein [Pseudohongiellaceae bacterium]
MIWGNRIADMLGSWIPLKADSSSARQGLLRLLLLRSFATVAGVFGFLVFSALSMLSISMLFVGWLTGAIVLSIVLGYWRLQRPWVMSYGELFSHLLLDVVFIVILLLNTGGVSNPLISYLLVLLAVSATMLPRPFVYSFAVSSILVYSSFLWLDLSTGHDMDMGSAENANQQSTFQLHLVGMWAIFLVSALLITVFVTRMANAIRERELNLAAARENEMRNEQLVAIGTLAAGTAHALGTPLSTMSVLLAELDKLDEDELSAAAIKDDIGLLRKQVGRCRNSLSQLIRYYHKDHEEETETSSLQAFANDIRDYITNIHPAAQVDFSVDADGEALVPSNPSFRHAVINIIENSIKAARSLVKVRFRCVAGSGGLSEISVADDGPGIPAEVMERQGEPFINFRRQSMGLGIFLANAAIQRLGGSIAMFNLKTGGAQTTIKIPLER